jgi:hypothetical protein
VHLGGIVAPHDDDVGGVEIVVAAGGFVHAVHREVAGDGGRHTEAGVGLDVVVGEAALHELLGGVTLGNRPLAAAVEGERLRLGENAPGHDVDGLLPRDRLHPAAAAQERLW